jgi:hypothetical protein
MDENHPFANAKRPFVCVVASAFEATTANMMFGYIKNTI